MNFVSSHKRIDVLSSLVLFILSFFVLLPLWWIVRSSFMSNVELYAYPPLVFPKKWIIENYRATLFYFEFVKYIKNSFLIVIPSVVGGTVTATMCGYAFARLDFRGKRFIFALCVGSMLLPTMVTLIPLFIMWTRFLGLGDTYWPLILPHFCGGGAFNIFLIRQFIKTIPKELDEAAKIDGAGYIRILTQVLVPNIKPAIIVIALLMFISFWNDMLQQIVYINTPEKFTIAIGLNMFRSGLRADWSKIMAATCLSFLPGISIFLIGQKYLVQGIIMSGLKN